jgi:type VI secretion system secreted protein Hcp
MNTNSATPEIRRLSGKLFRSPFGCLPRFRAVTAITCICALLFLSTAAWAQGLQSFLKLDGIDGDSVVKGHEGAIDILGFTSGVQTDPPAAGGAGVGKPQFFQIVVSKNIDKTSPVLMVGCATGKIFKTASLSTAKVGTNSTKDFFKIVLTNATITKVETTVSSGNSDKLTEYVELSFQKIQWTITTTNSKGESVTSTGGYDLLLGKTL